MEQPGQPNLLDQQFAGQLKKNIEGFRVLLGTGDKQLLAHKKGKGGIGEYGDYSANIIPSNIKCKNDCNYCYVKTVYFTKKIARAHKKWTMWKTLAR